MLGNYVAGEEWESDDDPKAKKEKTSDDVKQKESGAKKEKTSDEVKQEESGAAESSFGVSSICSPPPMMLPPPGMAALVTPTMVRPPAAKPRPPAASPPWHVIRNRVQEMADRTTCLSLST